MGVPAVGIDVGFQRLIVDVAGPVLEEDGELAAAAGAAGHPQHHGVGRGGAAALEEPVEVVLGLGGDGKVAARASEAGVEESDRGEELLARIPPGEQREQRLADDH
jgi:hypothetical protein